MPAADAAPDGTPIHRALGLTDSELDDIRGILGRDPNRLELSMYSVMWSEHCSYKSSRIHLKRLPTQGEGVLVGPGENAGVMDVGDGIAAAIRIESHNHPSYIEPYQGAATGAGAAPATLPLQQPIEPARDAQLDAPKDGVRRLSDRFQVPPAAEGWHPGSLAAPGRA